MKQALISELKNAGFEVTEFINGILVSLKNRKVSTMEVNTAIFQLMEIEVGMTPVSQGFFIGTVGW